jgi:cell filamentation protein
VAARFRTWNDYFIPGSHDVLRNKFTDLGKPHGEPDADKLRAAEEAAAHLRLIELAKDPIQGEFDYDHMKAIHRHIFQDVYEWAGQERVAPVGEFMSKDGHSYYGAGPALTEAAEAEYRKIAAGDYLRGMDQEPFVAELAERWGELNVVHSFREGNTRSQFVFFSQLAEAAGYKLDTEAFRPGNPLREEFVAARFHSQDTGSNKRLAAVLGLAITKLPPGLGAETLPDSPTKPSPSRASFPMSATEAMNTRTADRDPETPEADGPVARAPRAVRASFPASAADSLRQPSSQAPPARRGGPTTPDRSYGTGRD